MSMPQQPFGNPQQQPDYTPAEEQVVPQDVSEQPTMRTEAVNSQQVQAQQAMPGNGGGIDTDVATLERELTEAQRQAGEYLSMTQRLQADFINYKRRVTQEQSEGRLQAQAQIIEHILPVLDDLGRALMAVPPELAQHPWAQGIQLTSRQLISALQQLGVRQIGNPGELFNPQWHEALMKEPRPDLPEGTVAQVYRPGYVFGERVIRPAQVTVAGPAPSGEQNVSQ
ncbi:GrpE protein [Ktedonobacter racemifer DSM 44963]|uniref:Protein GrpE n=2 Tax=Ktedonobacter racemifer TaxID=363277 RepID=D6TRP9_KTERA|nr:GrpE protein [Ktedonobacter racemifer DSM 44963]